MDTNNIYEGDALSCITGETLRPGGFALTDRAAKLCRFERGSRVLDVGCASGATVEHLCKKHCLNACGIDPSTALIKRGRERNPELEISIGRGEQMPFEGESMDGVFAECTLSLMDDIDSTVEESHRVLKSGGWMVIADVYARNPEHLDLLEEFGGLGSCIRGLHSAQGLVSKLNTAGFRIAVLEDHSNLLKELMVKIIFEYGSMGAFWSRGGCCSKDSIRFQRALSKCKAGYFLALAVKER